MTDIGLWGQMEITVIGRFVTAAAALAVAIGGGGVAPAQPPRQAVVMLPAPTGPDPIGVVDMHLVGRSRPAPWTHNGSRELMISIWYPAASTAHTGLAPWLSPAVDALARGSAAAGRPKRWVLAPTHGHVDAPADVTHGPRPVLLYSPGAGVSREFRFVLDQVAAIAAGRDPAVPLALQLDSLRLFFAAMLG